jgi:hypothetical protein
MSKVKKIAVEEFDRIFDEGKEDIMEYLDLSRSEVHYPEPKRVNVDLPPWLIQELDDEAKRNALSRQAVIKTVLIRHVEERKKLTSA